MKAVMLAAGLGNRLSRDRPEPPKVLLKFGGRTLLARHIEILKRHGIEELVVGVGYQAQMVEAEIARLSARDFVRTQHNPDFTEGSGLTLLACAPAFASGEDVLLMDGDVLYDERLMTRLIESRHANCFLMDRDFEPGDEPVKLCLRGGRIVDFHKKVAGSFDVMGESVGFFRFSPAVAEAIIKRARIHAAAGARGLWYEESIRDVLLSQKPGTFGYEDITGLPWIEIDFPEDVTRAEAEVLPKLEKIMV